MEQKQIKNTSARVTLLIKQRRLAQAMRMLNTLVDETANWELRQALENTSTTYDYMLSYLAQGTDDPSRNDLLHTLSTKLYELNDRCVIVLSENTAPDVFYARRRELKDVMLSELLDQYHVTLNKYRLLLSVEESQRDKNAVLLTMGECERSETRLFNKIWSTFPLSGEDSAVVKQIIDNEIVPVHARCLAVAALFVGLMKFYDEEKLQLLLETYRTAQQSELQLRALTCAVIVMDQYRHRIEGSTALKQRVAALADSDRFAGDLTTVHRLLIRSLGTEAVTRRVTDDLIPGLMKMKPDIFGKLSDKQGEIDITDLEANPEWQRWLDDSGIAKKLEEFNELQSSGNDVFMATFSHLKGFPFFQTLSNWFLPYHDDHTAVINNLPAHQHVLAKLVDGAPYLCNSDKFSLTLSMGGLPQAQRNMMVQQLDAQHEHNKEMQSAELPDDKRLRETIVNKFVQDLYRFFTLFSRRKEFCPVFNSKMNLDTIPLLSQWLHNARNSEFVAEFYLKNGFYDEAIEAFTTMLQLDERINPIVYQKIGFAHQCAGRCDEAIAWYKRYELADDNNLWTIRHLISCYWRIRDYGNAIAYSLKAQELAPDNVSIVLNMGHIYLEHADNEQAMQCYLKADFMPGAKHRAWRPIAWCSFLVGNLDRSLTYYNKVMADDSPTAEDYLNHGHVLLATHDAQGCIREYSHALKMLKNDIDELTRMIDSDTPLLTERGIDNVTIGLCRDAAICSKQS